MNELAWLVQTVWRAICHYYTYTPEQLSISQINELEVLDDLLLVYDSRSLPNVIRLNEMDWRFAAMVSPDVFPNLRMG